MNLPRVWTATRSDKESSTMTLREAAACLPFLTTWFIRIVVSAYAENGS